MNDCPKCGHANPGSAKFCEGCGASMEMFNQLDDQLAEMLKKEARKGTWALGFVALATAVFPLVLGYANVVTWAVSGVFAVLAVWCLRAPLIASATGLSLYGLIVLADAVVDPATLVQGILGKILIVSVLVQAIRGGLKHREFQQQRGR